MKLWMGILGGLILVLSLSVRSQPEQGDGPQVLPGLRMVDMVRLQRKIMSGENPFTPVQMQIIQRWANVPDGAEKYGHELLLGLATPDQRLALTPLIRNIEAGPATPALHKRFWRLAFLIIAPEQAQALTPTLPFALQHHLNPSNYFSLPGLTGAQANRIKARLTEFEAVTQPLESQVKKAAKPEDALPIQEEMTTRMAEVEDDVAGILTPEQKAALLQLPPLTDGPELMGTLPDLMDGVTLSPDQVQQMQPLVAPLQQQQADATAKAKALEAEEQDGMAKMMRMHAIQDGMQQSMMGVARHLVAVLTDAQRIAWMHK